jgi:glyine---[glycyl-carrier protein] ligase
MLARALDLPLLAAQREIWMKQKIDPDNPIYNVGQYADIRGAVDPALFEDALRQAVAEAEAFWVRISEGADGPRQIIDDYPKWSMSFIDMSAELDPQLAAENWMKADLAKVDDITRGPLFNFILFKVSPEWFLWYSRVHHIIIDGFGGWLFSQRVADLYTAKVNNLPNGSSAFSPLQSLLDEERKYYATEQFVRDRQYWLESLAEMPEPVSFTDKPSFMSSGFLRQTGYFQPAGVETLQMIAHGAGASLSHVITALAVAYINRLTGANDNIFGLPATARLGAVSRNTPSNLVNMLPLRVTVFPDMTVSQLVPQVAQKIRRGLRHQRYRSEDLRRDLGLASTNRRLFGVLINVWSFNEDLYFAGHHATIHNLSNGGVEDLSIVVYYGSKDGGLRIDFNANPNLYTVADLLTHQRRFLRFLASVVAESQQTIGRIDLLEAEERRRILEDWNATEARYPAAGGQQEMCLHHLFEGQAGRTPDAMAVSFGTEQITYGELERSANRLANFLRARGVELESRVGICVERSVEMTVAILGVLKAGAACVPLDPSYPVERLKYMVRDGKVHWLITVGDAADVARQLLVDDAVQILRLDYEEIEAEASTPPQLTVDPENLLYVIYTSGSTGRPKGVALSHLAVANLICWDGTILLPKSRTLQFSSLNFDASFHELFMTWASGGAIVLITREQQRDPRSLSVEIRNQRVERLNLPAAAIDPILEELAAAGDDSVSELISTAEQMQIAPRWWQWLERRCCSVWNHYGPSETHVITAWQAWSNSLGNLNHPPIGRPIANCRAYVLNGELQPVPQGVVGELYLGGVGVARGYLNQAQQTAERFLPDLHNPTAGARMYRTGDLARHLHDGGVEYLGRIDHQVKIRGFRVELGEIEARLAEHSAVREAAVVAREDRPGEKQLVGYVVLRSTTSCANNPETRDETGALPKELKRYVANQLPEYMVPVAIVVLDRLPLTANGKLDRKALPVPEVTSAADYRAPQKPQEKILCELCAEVLGVERVGIEDNFFDLGGHSLLVMQMMSRVQAALEVELDIRTLFEFPTMRALAEVIEEKLREQIEQLSEQESPS